MRLVRILLLALLTGSLATAATGRERLIELRAKLAEAGTAGRSSSWKKEIRFAETLTAEPGVAAQTLYDVARAQMQSDSRHAVPTFETLLEKFPKAEPWASLAAYRLGMLLAGSTSTRPQAVKHLERYLASKGRDPVRTAQALLQLAAIEAEANKHEQALARLTGLLGRFPGYDKIRAQALGHIGRIQLALKQPEQAEATCKRLAAECPWDTEQRGALLGAIIQAHRTGENFDAAIAACDLYLADIHGPTYSRAQVYVALATLHAKQQNPDAVGATYRRMAADQALPSDDRQKARLYLFAHYRRTGDQAAIVREAQQLIAADALDAATTDELLGALVDALIATGRLDDAIAVARASFRLSRVALEVSKARSSSRSGKASHGDEAIFSVVRALKAKEGGLRAANAFIQYLSQAPEGPDGKPGTADDAVDPLAKWALQPDPERDRLYADAARGLHAEPLKLACLYTCWDKPADALRAFRLHTLRSTSSTGLRTAAIAMAQAMRALGRPEAEVDAFFDLQNYGPDGEDGKPNTADDVKDPILELK